MKGLLLGLFGTMIIGIGALNIFSGLEIVDMVRNGKY